MDFFNKAGKGAIGSRLRMFSERLTEDASGIYQLYDVPIEPKWFPVFYVLSQKEQMGITDIANEIGHSHPSVSKIVREMAKQGLVEEKKDTADKRRNLVSLSKKGKKIMPGMDRAYTDVTNVIEELLGQTRHNLWKAIDEMEFLLSQKTLIKRVVEKKKAREAESVQIITYQPQYQAFFKSLNEEWITQYFTMEELDKQVLDHPEAYILDKGGEIIFALYENEVVGTCAIIPVKDQENWYELAKMAVSPRAQGKGIGFILGEQAIAYAKKMGAKRMYLESNTVLEPAINLYRKLGFQKVTGHVTPYERSNIQMELPLE